MPISRQAHPLLPPLQVLSTLPQVITLLQVVGRAVRSNFRLGTRQILLPQLLPGLYSSMQARTLGRMMPALWTCLLVLPFPVLADKLLSLAVHRTAMLAVLPGLKPGRAAQALEALQVSREVTPILARAVRCRCQLVMQRLPEVSAVTQRT